ncbi:MAG: hypothetical protein ACHQHN_18800 [Sphingobacteriales bacterium]
MKNELYTLAQLTDERYNDEQFIQECSRIRSVWTALLFSGAREDMIRRHIRYAQRALLDVTAAAYKDDPQSRLAHLMSLNDFLFHYFHAYIDPEIPAFTLIGEQQAAQAEKVRSQLKTESNAGLTAIVLGYIDGFTTAETPVTYRSAAYFSHFTETLSRELAGGNKQDLTQVLFYLNFNDNHFYRWYTDHLLRQEEAIKPADRPAFLRRALLNLQAMPVAATMSYDPLLLPIHQQLANWLEIHMKIETPELSSKLELKLTVAQLSLLLRLLYEEDVFTVKRIASLLRFFSSHFMSKRQEQISYGSMNKLYYSPDQFTAYAIREILLKMTAKTNKMFFPK